MGMPMRSVRPPAWRQETDWKDYLKMPLAAARHGTRACYQQSGCRCTPCRAANAAYEAQRAADKAAGKIRLGMIVNGAEAMKRIKQLKAEKISGRALNRLHGLKNHAFVLHDGGITLRKLYRIRRTYRLFMLENRDAAPENRENV